MNKHTPFIRRVEDEKKTVKRIKEARKAATPKWRINTLLSTNFIIIIVIKTKELTFVTNYGMLFKLECHETYFSNEKKKKQNSFSAFMLHWWTIIEDQKFQVIKKIMRKRNKISFHIVVAGYQWNIWTTTTIKLINDMWSLIRDNFFFVRSFHMGSRISVW